MKSRTDLNGKQAKVVEYNESTKSYVLNFAGDELFMGARENLTLVNDADQVSGKVVIEETDLAAQKFSNFNYCELGWIVDAFDKAAVDTGHGDANTLDQASVAKLLKKYLQCRYPNRLATYEISEALLERATQEVRIDLNA